MGRGLIPGAGWTSASIVDHQNRRRMKSNMRVIPGWQVSLEEWAQTSTLDCTASGTKKTVGETGTGV